MRPFLFLSSEEGDGFFLAGAVAETSMVFSGTGIGATVVALAMDVGGAAAGQQKSQDFAGCCGFYDLSAFASRLHCLSPQLKIKQVAIASGPVLRGGQSRLTDRPAPLAS
jgi:hypothetical protein